MQTHKTNADQSVLFWKKAQIKIGDIPDGALVALRTDWYKNWPDMDALSGTGEDGAKTSPVGSDGSFEIHI